MADLELLEPGDETDEEEIDEEQRSEDGAEEEERREREEGLPSEAIRDIGILFNFIETC
jgi:hypothetical protein